MRKAMTTTTKRVATPPQLLARLKRAWAGEGAAQIVEFAVSLPLLILFVVGIFDFSNAVALKQKLTNAAREAARVAAADSANDLGNPSTAVPASVGDAFQVADNYLIADKVNDCGLSTATRARAHRPYVDLHRQRWRVPGNRNLPCHQSGLHQPSHREWEYPQFGRNLHHPQLRIQVAVQQRGFHLWMGWCAHQQLDRKSHGAERELRIPMLSPIIRRTARTAATTTGSSARRIRTNDPRSSDRTGKRARRHHCARGRGHGQHHRDGSALHRHWHALPGQGRSPASRRCGCFGGSQIDFHFRHHRRSQ